ncbi:prepilin-type N-terminal cleavage/methylation domain-containing protein [Sporosarcina sp. PTS2304]|uniref:type IV pilus modification PilV family protein n=1 Tax=Sporosarcina sp. PTS2304 TaxID=2283194 RepID=UPI000E0D0A45|nr:prepilin-type N-terminal cleavage/methylation domain-containing protein [Sporosarcina sp. PTS2304]AXH99323.1 prepilin-type N-terminal cleavage/methylation domain-containing protein [Sporosarcina sp. PTS2304]
MVGRSEEGMSLVEVLAALFILGIVFISFMTIFPQMISVNERTETKLQTMNIAKTELVELKDDTSDNLKAENKSKSSTGPGDFETYTYSKPSGVIVEIDCYNVGNETCSGVGSDPAVRQEELYKIHIKIKKNENIISETFGYLELK